MTKFCKDCRWCVDTRDWADKLLRFKFRTYAHCTQPRVLEHDDSRFREYLVTGKATETPFCSSARIAPCGPSGRLWEPIEGYSERVGR